MTFVPTGNSATCMCGVVASRPAERVKSMDAGACCDEFGLAVVHNLHVFGSDLVRKGSELSRGRQRDAGACCDGIGLAVVDDLRVDDDAIG